MYSSRKNTITIFLSSMLLVIVCGLLFSIFHSSNQLNKDDKDDQRECAHSLKYVEAQEATCTVNGWKKYAYCEKCNYDNKEIVYAEGHHFTYIMGEFFCNTCNASLDLTSVYDFSSGTLDGMTGVYGNDSNFRVTGNTLLPYYDGHNYSFIKNTTTIEKKQAQLWIPKEASGFSGFSSENNAVGVFSCDLNVSVDYCMEIILVEGESANRWGVDWCLKEYVFKIDPLMDANGDLWYKFLDIHGDTLDIKKADSADFTGFFNLTIGIDLNPIEDKVYFHYYIDGVHRGTVATDLTTQENSITSIYISAKTKAKNSGYFFNNLVFGYAEHSAWDF